MWYEIVPTVGIFSFFLFLPIYVPWGMNLIWRQKLNRRTCFLVQDKKFTMRDERITGNYYKHLGLDSIPDK